MGYTIRADPALMQPARTVRVGVADGDRLVRPPINLDPANEQPTGGIGSGDDADLWVIAGPPPATPPPGLEPGDAWIDVASGDVYVYDPE